MSDDFLSRWSRRKRAVAAEGEPAEAEGPAEAAPEPQPEPVEEETEAELLERLGLPDPDEMKAGDDFSAFMKAAVPEALRRRALRRLWRSNPVLACLDGLNDYDGDFTGDTVAPGQLKTLYRVGRGFLRDSEDGTDEAETAGAPVVREEVAEGGDDAPAETADAPVPEEMQNPGENDTGRQEMQDAPDGGVAAARRRMAFHFPDQ